jgi:hypothetical protein
MAVAGMAEQMPAIHGESLSGKPVSLPEASRGSLAILCIGFSHGSQSQLKPWTGKLTAQSQKPGVSVYSIAVLEDAPRFVRGMIVHGIKSGIPQSQQDRFLIVVKGEDELKRVTAYQKPDDAYILLLDGKGQVQWVHHGPVSDAALVELSDRSKAIGTENR